MRSYYSSDEEWNAALEAVGTTEDQYRDMIELSLTETGLKDKVATATEPPRTRKCFSMLRCTHPPMMVRRNQAVSVFASRRPGNSAGGSR